MDSLFLILVPIAIAVSLCALAFAGCDAFDAAPGVLLPTEFKATATGPRRVELTWKDNMNGTTTYVVERMNLDQTGRMVIDTVTGESCLDQSPTLKDGTSYVYIVRLNTTGPPNPAADSNQARVTTPPDPPTGLRASAEGEGHIKVQWDATTRPYTFRLEHRSAGSGTFQPLVTVSETSYPHTGLQPGTEHEYRVIAVVLGVSGEVSSAPSLVANATTPATTPVWKQAFAGALSTNPPQRRGDCLVQVIPAPLEHGGTKLRVTLRGSTAAALVLEAVTISEAPPAGGTANPWDSATVPVRLLAGGSPSIRIAANTAVMLDVAAYTLNPARDHLIAFDINDPDGGMRSGPRDGAKAYIRNNLHEANTQDRSSTGYTLNSNVVFLVEKIEVL